MGYLKREEKKESRSFKRLQPDMRIVLGKGEVKHLQAIAQNKTDGMFYAYKAGDENLGVIAGLYTGEDIEVTATNHTGRISTQIIIAKDDIQGINWAEDFTAVSQLKLAGVIFAPLIVGTKEA